ncbi:MAG: YlmH/Sll1252 family protein [Lachnospiraceae bacterium]
MNKDTSQLKKRFLDLSENAIRNGFVTFSNFLAPAEISDFHQIKGSIFTEYELSGGFEHAERQMIAFLPDAFYYDWEFPIQCLEFIPTSMKYAQDITHRDVLGALMSLGIERDTIGDIRVEDKVFYVVCTTTISSYILKELASVKHTAYQGTICSPDKVISEQEFEELEYIVSSTRLDAIVSSITRSSRSKAVQMIQAQKIFLDGIVTTENARICKENVSISIRGHGKFLFTGTKSQTKKGNIVIHIKKFV